MPFLCQPQLSYEYLHLLFHGSLGIDIQPTLPDGHQMVRRNGKGMWQRGFPGMDAPGVYPILYDCLSLA